MKRSLLCLTVGAGFLGILIPSFFSLFANPPRGWGRSNSSQQQSQCTAQRRGPHGETINVPVDCSDPSAQRNQNRSNSGNRVINITDRTINKNKAGKSRAPSVLPKGFYSVEVDEKKGKLWIKWNEEISASDMDRCDIATFSGDPKEIFGRKLGQRILDARPSSAGSSVRLGVLNRGGQAAINRCLNRGKIGLSALGLCAGGAVTGDLKFGDNGSVMFSESCGGSGGGGAGGCKDMPLSPGGGDANEGANRDHGISRESGSAPADRFMRSSGGGEAMSGGSGSNENQSSGSTPVGQPLGPNETRYTRYDYSKEGLTTITSTTISQNGDYTVDQTYCDSSGCDATTYSGNLITSDDVAATSDVLQEVQEVEERQERTADVGDEESKPYARVERRGEMPTCDASGENCTGGGNWRVGFPIPTTEELRRAIGNAARPQRPGSNTTDCFGDDCGGSGEGAPQPGVVLTNAMITSLPGSGLVDPMGPDDAGRTGGSAPPGGGGICSPNGIFWVSNNEYSLDCDMRAQGGCDNQSAFRQAFQAIQQSKSRNGGASRSGRIQRGVQRNAR